MSAPDVVAPIERRSWLSRGFEAGILVKGLFAGLEILAGALLLLFGKQAAAFAMTVASYGGTAHPGPVTACLAHLTAGLSVEGARFCALFLMAHGVVKAAAVIALLRRAPWACPFAVSVLSAFVLYQLHRYAQTGGIGLLVLSAFDALIICLIVREYRVDAAARP